MAVSGQTIAPSKSIVVHTWSTVTQEGIGTPVDMSRFEELTFQIYGTTSSAHGELWGSNTSSGMTTATDAQWSQLHVFGNATKFVSGQSKYIAMVLENPRWIAPVVSGATATTATGIAVNFSIVARG